jgi:hypothetical protein
MSNENHDSNTSNCCEAVYNALTTYLQGQSAVLDQPFPTTGNGINSLAVIQGEAASLLSQVQTALNSLLTNNCKCGCCISPADAVAAAYLSALQQAGYLTLNTVATAPATPNGLTTAFVGSPPSPGTANVITVPPQSTTPTNGYVNIAASIASYSATVPPPTPTQIATFTAALLAYRSTLQANIEDFVIAPNVASANAILAYFACPPPCPPATCFKARKEESTDCAPSDRKERSHKHKERR